MQMIENQISDDDLIDALADLKHDLGKYLRLPFSMLPPGETQEQLREAVERAILKTRSGPRGVRPARDIWSGFVEEIGARGMAFNSFPGLRDSVERALAWLGETGKLDRVAIESDMAAVGKAVQGFIEEVLDD